MNDLYHVVAPSIAVGALMMLVDVYGAPWFAEMWWVLHP